MNALALSVPAFISYVAFIYWLMIKVNFKEIWSEPLNNMKSDKSMTLTLFTKRLLDLFLFLFLITSIIMPIAVVVMAISQNHSSIWGIDIAVFSGFMIDLNQISNLDATGVRNPEFSGKTLINVDTSNLFAWYLFSFISELSAVIVIFVIVQLRAIVLSLHNGMALIDENSQRIQKIGIIVIVWNLLTPILQYYGWGNVVDKISINNVGFSFYPAFEVNIMALLIGILLILLSKILQEVRIIKQEQELTI